MLNGANATFRLRARRSNRSEVNLEEADRTGRQRALLRVAQRLGGFRVDSLLQTVDAKVPTLFGVAPEFLEALAAPDAVDTALRSMDAAPGHVRFADGTRRNTIPEVADLITDARGEAGVHELMCFGASEAFRRGYTLILNNLVPRLRGELQEFSEDLSRSVGTPIQVNLYASEREAPGFGRHWDDHDVLVVQCVGRKHWTVYEPVELSARIGYAQQRSFGKEYFSTVLEPGLGIYVPRGWGHQVQGFVDELSLHYTVGMRFLTGIDVIRHVLTGKSDGHTLLDTTPGDAPICPIGSDDIDQAVAAHRAGMRSLHGDGPVSLFAAHQAAFDGATCRAPFIGGVVFVDSPDLGSDEVGIATGGHLFALNEIAVPTVAKLVRGEELRLSDPESPATRTALSLAASGATGIRLAGD